jgi:hypothetical protein
MTSLFCLFAHKHRHEFVCLLNWPLLSVILFQKKKNSLDFPSTCTLKCSPSLSSSCPPFSVYKLPWPSSVTTHNYRKLDSFDQRVRARRIRETKLYVFSLSLPPSFSLSLCLYLVGSIKRESKKRRRKKRKERTYFRMVVATVFSSQPRTTHHHHQCGYMP